MVVVNAVSSIINITAGLWNDNKLFIGSVTLLYCIFVVDFLFLLVHRRPNVFRYIKGACSSSFLVLLGTVDELGLRAELKCMLHAPVEYL